MAREGGKQISGFNRPHADQMISPRTQNRIRMLGEYQRRDISTMASQGGDAGPGADEPYAHALIMRACSHELRARREGHHVHPFPMAHNIICCRPSAVWDAPELEKSGTAAAIEQVRRAVA